MAECRFCRYFILEGTTRCAHCGRELAKWRRVLSSVIRFSTLLGAVATAIMAGFIWMQSIKIKEQADAINNQTASIKQQTDIALQRHLLENRPYLYIDIKPTVGFDESGDSFYSGAEIKYRNSGLFAASDIETEAKVGSDITITGLIDMTEWYQRVYHDYPYVKTVFPNQDIPERKYTPNIGSKKSGLPEFVYIGVRIHYKGFAEDRYCYGVDYVYKIEHSASDKGEVFSAINLKYDTFWDMNKNDGMEPIKMPDWGKYKNIPEHAEAEQADNLATSLGVVYIGMPKESLYQVFSELQQKNYRKDGIEE